MASITDIVQVECANHDTIYLYQEGIFYKAYGHSAWLFVTYVRPFSVKCRLVKVVGGMIASTGFPMASAEKLFEGCECLKGEKLLKVKLSCGQEFDKAAYVAWKHDVEQRATVAAAVCIPAASASLSGKLAPADTCIGEEVLCRLRAFPIERKTPMECMFFLSELKHICEN